jgi:hypothetical protein
VLFQLTDLAADVGLGRLALDRDLGEAPQISHLKE